MFTDLTDEPNVRNRFQAEPVTQIYKTLKN